MVLAAPKVSEHRHDRARRRQRRSRRGEPRAVDVEGDGLLFFQTSASDATNRLEQLGRIAGRRRQRRDARGGARELRRHGAQHVRRGPGAEHRQPQRPHRHRRRRRRHHARVGPARCVRAGGRRERRRDHRAGRRDPGRRRRADRCVGRCRAAAAMRIGGDFHGAGAEVRNAQIAAVAPGATLSADASARRRRRPASWSGRTTRTRYYGAISARGGSAGGDGGTAEVSGKSARLVGAVDTRRRTAGPARCSSTRPTSSFLSAARCRANRAQPRRADGRRLRSTDQVRRGAATFTISSNRSRPSPPRTTSICRRRIRSRSTTSKPCPAARHVDASAPPPAASPASAPAPAASRWPPETRSR